MSLITLYLIRHGHTIWHDSGGVAGRTDIELSKAGAVAVSSLADTWLQDSSPDHWYSSPMRRTRQSVDILRSHMPLSGQMSDTIEDSRLLELDFGDWEGLTWKDVHQHHENEMQAWGVDWVNRSPPNGETFAAQQLRCVAWLDDMLADTDNADKRQVVVATHGGSIRALLCYCLDWPLGRAMSFNVDPATVTELEFNRVDGSWLARSINSNRFHLARDIV